MARAVSKIEREIRDLTISSRRPEELDAAARKVSVMAVANCFL
jgi:hypothetical protein